MSDNKDKATSSSVWSSIEKLGTDVTALQVGIKELSGDIGKLGQIVRSNAERVDDQIAANAAQIRDLAGAQRPQMQTIFMGAALLVTLITAVGSACLAPLWQADRHLDEVFEQHVADGHLPTIKALMGAANQIELNRNELSNLSSTVDLKLESLEREQAIYRKDSARELDRIQRLAQHNRMQTVVREAIGARADDSEPLP